MSAIHKLEAVKEQLVASCESLATLSMQHQQWQRSVEQMLADVQASLTIPDLSESEPRGQKKLSHSGSMSMPSVHSRKSAALHPLLQSRESVAPQYPAGPLRKLLGEMIAPSEDAATPMAVGELAQRWAASVVSSSYFEFVAGFVILLNMIAIGAEAQMSLEPGQQTDSFWFGGVERIFLAVYCVEAIFRAFAGGWRVLCDPWFIMDLSLVCVGLTALLVIPYGFEGNEHLEGFEKVLVVRGLRLLRLARVFRMVHHFKIIWRLVYGLLTAGQTIFSTTVLILLSLFIFACVAVELIAKDVELNNHETTKAIVEHNFAGVGRSMMTLMQFVTLDGLAEFYYPLILLKPWLVLYFLPILVFVSIGLLNLVTAALVENAMDNAEARADEERLRLKRRVRGALPALLDIFRELDKDASGLITHEEVDEVPIDILPPRVLDSVYVDNMRDIFDLLDVNGAGVLTQMEFVEGLLNLCLLDMPMWTMQQMKLLKLMHEQIGNLGLALEVVSVRLAKSDVVCM
ncbi:unnamed protein product [Effrenium voratum]|nr:unnamed protein product [Effrenium voratum]